jgi:hypothetical protein
MIDGAFNGKYLSIRDRDALLSSMKKVVKKHRFLAIKGELPE